MSQYVETNPHFAPTQRPGVQIPENIEPESRQPWEHAPVPNYPDQVSQPPRILPKTRRSRTRPTSLPTQPPSTPPSQSLQPGPKSYMPVVQQTQPQPQQPQSQPQPQPQHRPHHPIPYFGPNSSSHPPPSTQPQSQPQPQPQHRPHHPIPYLGPSSSSHPPPSAQPQHQPQPPPHFGPSTSSHPPPPAQPRPKPQEQEYGVPLPPRHNLMYPTLNKTKPLTWFGAVFCCILWLVIILGGLLVLIVYLVYRPRTPHFEISNASLNAAYLDMGTLLNADMTVLANFTNRNKKVKVDFTYATFHLHFANHPIAIQYVEPFSVPNTQKKLQYVELVSSQVRLPSGVTQQLVNQMQSNRIVFQVDAIFHTRSDFGSLLRYSYWLYAHCTIAMTAPPTGVIIERHCRTKD